MSEYPNPERAAEIKRRKLINRISAQKELNNLPTDYELGRSLQNAQMNPESNKNTVTTATPSNPPMGVSAWINHGKKYGYFDFAVEERVKETLAVVCSSCAAWQKDRGYRGCAAHVKALDTAITAQQQAMEGEPDVKA